MSASLLVVAVEKVLGQFLAVAKVDGLFLVSIGGAGRGQVKSALAAIGLTAILWLLASALFRQPPVRDTWYIVALSGDGAGLDVTLRALAQNRRLPVVLVDCGLTEEGRRAASLAVSDTVTLVTPSELPNLFTQETRKG